jgi:hypothetical protein
LSVAAINHFRTYPSPAANKSQSFGFSVKISTGPPLLGGPNPLSAAVHSQNDGQCFRLSVKILCRSALICWRGKNYWFFRCSNPL